MMKIKMRLLSDAIPGNGESISGAEDISVLHDEFGFPYYKGGTLKGIFREELVNSLCWDGKTDDEVKTELQELLGASGDDKNDERKLWFSDLRLSDGVKEAVLSTKIDGRRLSPDDILDSFSYMRTFTAIDKKGIVKEGSLRNARCLKEGLVFYGEISCLEKDEELVKGVISQIRRIGTMRNRGFGSVKIEAIQEAV